MFIRNSYYSQTEAVKKFRITVKKYKEIIKDMEQVNREIDLGGYTVTTIYIRKELIDALKIELRK